MNILILIGTLSIFISFIGLGFSMDVGKDNGKKPTIFLVTMFLGVLLSAFGTLIQ